MGVQLPSEPITRKEQYLAKAAGQAVEIPAEPITREEAYLDAIAKGSGGGGGGTSDYPQLTNKPQINGNTLVGNKTASQLGLASTADLAGKVDKVEGKGLSSNDYSDTEKQKNADNATAISAIKDGATIDSFADVESALSNKQDTLTFDDVPTANSNNPVKSGGVKSAIDAAVSSAYHHAGTKTCAELVAGLLVAGNEGNVYNMTDSGTTTADFIEGAGQPIKAGDNVGIAKISDGVYKFDLLSGFVDTTNFVQKSVTAGLLKNDGTVNDEIEGDVSTLKSGLTTLDNEVNGDATTYPYADVITIEDAVPSNLADCSVKIEPVQDLHGQSAPYVGGAGKQKLPMTVDGIKEANTEGTWNGNVYTINNGTITVNTDSDGNVVGIYVSGIFSALTYFVISSSINTTALAGCLVNGLPDSQTTLLRFRIMTQSSTSVTQDITWNGDAIVDNGDNLRFAIRIADTESSLNASFYPMIRLSTETDATFAPYTNICPISGHTEASVQRDGKNLWTGKFLNSAFAVSDTYGGNYKFAGNKNQRVYPNTTYCYSVNGVSKEMRYVIGDINGNEIVSPTTASYVTIPNDGAFITWRSVDDVLSGDVKAQLELGSTATPYVPYAGKTYTISLGDTIYGGTVDFDSGVMTVTHALVEYDGSEDETWAFTDAEHVAYIAVPTPAKYKHTPIANWLKGLYNVSYRSLLNGEFAFSIDGGYANYMNMRVTSIDNLASWKTYLASNPLQVCYELATPTTIQLTPQQIQLLKGQNTLTASTGDISVTVNGVSGSIGAVQEQVNELAEDVAEIQTVDYSTTEQKTGQKWIDGKDIYFCTYTGLTLTTTGSWQDTGIDSSNIDTLLFGLAIDDSKQSIVCSFGFGNNASVILRAYMSTNVIKSVTLFYTKTT